MVSLTLCRFLDHPVYIIDFCTFMRHPVKKLLSYGVVTRSSKDPAKIQQTSSKCIQNARANAGRLLDRVNTLLRG